MVKLNKSKKIIVVLEQAHIEIIRQSKGHTILNPDHHLNLIKSNNLDPSSIRPDILYQCLRVLQESPLNRAGHLQVLIRTKQNILIEVSNNLRVPNTFSKFAKLMVQLHKNFKVNAIREPKRAPRRLMKIIKNDINTHLPAGVRKIGFSHKATKIVKPQSLIPKDEDIVVVIGAMAHGSVTDSCDFLHDIVSITHLPLSGAFACAELCDAAAKVWDIENQDLNE